MGDTNQLQYEDQGDTFVGFLARPETEESQHPGVLIAHPAGGLDSFIKEQTIRLADLGYVALAADFWGRGLLAESTDQKKSLMAPFNEDRMKLRQRICSALDVLRNLDGVDSSRLAAIGYCFGGKCVLDLARSGADVRCVCSFHGLLDPPPFEDGGPIKARILACHGYDDPFVSQEQQEAFKADLTEKQVDWQMHIYGGAMHAFTMPAAQKPDAGVQYHEPSARRSWATMVAFLKESMI